MKLSWKISDPNTHVGLSSPLVFGCPQDIYEAWKAGENWRWLQPETVAVPGTKFRELTADWWGIVNGSLLCIRKGYRFNGASIPRIFWVVVGHPFDPRHEVAALIHDILYGTGMLPRGQADWVLREVIEKTKGKMQHIHAGVFWSCVRGLGWAYGFGKSRKDMKHIEVWCPYGTVLEA